MNGTTSRRNWTTWLRRLGLLTTYAEGPEVLEPVQPVIVVGNEKLLREHWSGPVGLCGGKGSEEVNPVAAFPRVTVVAPPSGCWVQIDTTSNEALGTKQAYDFYDDPANLLVNSQANSSYRPTITNGESEHPCQTVVWIDLVETILEAGIQPIAIFAGYGDASTRSIAAGQRVSWPSDTAEYWVGPGRLLVIVCAGTEYWIQVRIREPGAARRGTE